MSEERGKPEKDPAWSGFCKELAGFESAGERRGRRWRGVLRLVLGVVGLFVALTAFTFGSHFTGAPRTSPHASTIVVESCAQSGPVSRFGLGFWWSCSTGEVDAEDAITLHGSEITPDDIGKSVRITSDRSANSGASDYHVDAEHPMYAPGVIAGFVCFLGGLALLATGVIKLLPLEIPLSVDKKRALRLHERYRLAGRGPLPVPPPHVVREVAAKE